MSLTISLSFKRRKIVGNQNCRGWYEGDPIMEEYHDHEWCKINHDDRFEFEMLCLEGASVGLSWKTIKIGRASCRERV